MNTEYQRSTIYPNPNPKSFTAHVYTMQYKLTSTLAQFNATEVDRPQSVYKLRCKDERQFPCLLSYHQRLPAASISLILQGFGQLAQGLSCSMHPQAKSNWARQPGLFGLFQVQFWEIVGVWGCQVLQTGRRCHQTGSSSAESAFWAFINGADNTRVLSVSTALKSCFGRQSGNLLGQTCVYSFTDFFFLSL